MTDYNLVEVCDGKPWVFGSKMTMQIGKRGAEDITKELGCGMCTEVISLKFSHTCKERPQEVTLHNSDSVRIRVTVFVVLTGGLSCARSCKTRLIRVDYGSKWDL